MAVVSVIEPGLGVVHIEHGVEVVGGVLLHQIQLPLAALEHGVVVDLAPLVVAGPRDDAAVHGGGQVVRSPQVVRVVVGMELALVVEHCGAAVLNALDHDAQPGLVAVDVPVIQAVDLVLHQGLVGLGGEVHHELLDHRARLFHVAAGGLVLVAVAVPVVAVVPVAAVAVGDRPETDAASAEQGLQIPGGLILAAEVVPIIAILAAIMVPVVAGIAIIAAVPVAIPVIAIVAGIGYIGQVGRLVAGVHIVVAIAVLGDDPGVLHQSAQAVVGVDALLAVAVDAPDHPVGLVVDILPGTGQLLVLAVSLIDQIAPVVVCAHRVGLPAVGGAVHLLVQIVVDVVTGMTARPVSSVRFPRLS